MELLIVSFIAGVLTVAAPCILPLLPVIVGGSLTRGDQDKPEHSWYRPLIIAGSLAVSVIVFSLLLKATTALLGVSQMVWQLLAGTVVLLFGINLLLPVLWEKLALLSGLHTGANRLLGSSFARKGIAGDVMIGFALGPIFNSCSPTYALIVATILPATFAKGFVYLLVYAIGLAGMLLVIAYAGQSVVKRLGWAANPGSWFRRVIGILFILVGLGVITSLDKKAQEFVLDQGWYDPIGRFEESLR